MISYGKSAGLTSINVNTNGMLLTADLVEPLMNTGVDLIVIGIDGFSKEVFEKLRVNAKRDEVYANVEYLLKKRKEKDDGPEIQVQFIEMEENKNELEQYKAYWLEKGATVKARRMPSRHSKESSWRMICALFRATYPSNCVICPCPIS